VALATDAERVEEAMEALSGSSTTTSLLMEVSPEAASSNSL
jgi:hypothetical protein